MTHAPEPESVVHALVVTVSTRAAGGIYEDRSGPVLADGLRAWGCVVAGPTVVPDGPGLERVLREGIAAGYDVVVTTGGTGIAPADTTPEATRRALDAEIPGVAEAIRAHGRDSGVPAAMLSRGIAGRAGTTFVVNLPGSTGGVRDGLAVLEPVVFHAVDQMRGGDHAIPAGSDHAGSAGGDHAGSAQERGGEGG